MCYAMVKARCWCRFRCVYCSIGGGISHSVWPLDRLVGMTQRWNHVIDTMPTHAHRIRRRGDIHSGAVVVLSWIQRLPTWLQRETSYEDWRVMRYNAILVDVGHFFFLFLSPVLFQMRFWRIAFIYSPVALEPTVTSITMLSLLSDNLKNKLRPISRCTGNQTEMVNYSCVVDDDDLNGCLWLPYNL